MKLICDGADLAEAIGVVSRVTSARAINQTLEGVKLTAKDGVLTFAGTDLEMYIQKTIRADIKADGACVVPGKLFNDYVSKLGKSSVSLDLAGENLQITHADNVGHFQCYSLVDYPDIINISKKPHFSIKAEAFRDFITKVCISVGQDDSRPVLKGVLCEIGKTKIVGVALDGYRLTKIEKEINNPSGDLKIVIPARSLEEIKKIITDITADIGLSVDEKFVQITVNKTTFVARLIDGEFINYAQIIPQKFESTAVVERAALDQAVSRAGLLNRNEKTNIITMNLTEKSMTVTANNELGKINEKVAISLKGKDVAKTFNAKYVADVLKVITDPFIKFNCSQDLSPCIIENAKDGGDYAFLILPIRQS